MNLEQMKAAHRQPKMEAEDEGVDLAKLLGPLHADRVFPPWIEDAMREMMEESTPDEADDEFEDLEDTLEASLQDSVELLHQAMDLLGKYGQRRHPITVEVKKEFVEMAQRIFETLEQYNLLEETHR